MLSSTCPGLTADTYGKISEDFVRFIWMVATSASTNFRPSQLPPTDTLAPVLDEFAVQHGFFFSRMRRVQLAAAIAKAAAARFVQDDVDSGLPIHTLYEQKVAGQALDLPDLPMYHVPSYGTFFLWLFSCVLRACLLVSVQFLSSVSVCAVRL
jgi:hypothetical protein